MVFVAGQIPRELRRVVEFLNEQMAAEVIAIEAKQYVGPEGLRTLVPRVVGQTAAAETRKRPREGRRWDEASLLAEMADRQGGEIAAVVGKLIAWATAHEGVRVAYSKGANRSASRAPECMPGRRPCST